MSLYTCEEKPANPVDFVRKVMGDRRPTSEDMENMKADLKASVLVQRSLAQDNQRLRERLQELEPDSDLLASSVVPPELLLPLEEEPVEDEAKYQTDYEGADAESDVGEGDIQLVHGEQFQLRKDAGHAEAEVHEQSEPAEEPEAPQQPAEEPEQKSAEEAPHAEALSVASEVQPEVKSIRSDSVSEKKSAPGIEEPQETPAVAASDGAQARLSDEDVAPLH